MKNKTRPQVLASASRIYDEKIAEHSYSFICKSPSKTMNSMRVLLPSKPEETILVDNKGQKLTDVELSWDAASSTYYLKFENDPEGVEIKITW